jgi:gliding motility-associated-like protein
MLVRNNKHFFLYLSILILSMKKLKNILLIATLLISTNAYSQCNYTLDNYEHINCYRGNDGAIDITLLNAGTNVWWTGPGGFNSTSSNLSSLIAGDYTLHIINPTLSDTCVDTIPIYQTLQITAEFILSAMCNEDDSADVRTKILGGTPPYTTLWSTGDTARSTDSLAPSILPYQLYITDANGCAGSEDLIVSSSSAMNPFMSSVGVICKDDNTGEARVFVQEGTPPFQFQWSTDSAIVIEHDSFAVIEGLFPGEYRVKITDDMGCVTRDTIVVKSNPGICLTIYKVFSPNDDDTHEFWEIENINLYPEALVMVYDRTGRLVYRRRNYENAEGKAFGGKDLEGRTLPSSTYYYIINLENGDDVFKGALTIVR